MEENNRCHAHNEGKPKPMPKAEGNEERFNELAQLPLVDYEQCRRAEAKAMGIRVQALDSEVAERRARDAEDDGGSTAALFEDLDPWPEPVDGAELLADITRAFRCFLALPKHAAEVIALWIMHAHAHDVWQISPILAFVSPEKRCGKTRALQILHHLVPRPLAASNITPASLFRATEEWRPTLLLDEADTFLPNSDELRGILNSGHNRAMAKVVRTVGEDHEPWAFQTWAPKVIAMIGALPPTLEDRSIVIRMRRRRSDEHVGRLRGDRDQGFRDLVRRCVRWTADHLSRLGEADPDLPKALNDREADNWLPLVAIADEAGGDWPAVARSAAGALVRQEDETSQGALLLADVRQVFGEAGNPERMSSSDLCEALVALPDRPWVEIGKNGKPLTTNKLARSLKPYDVRPYQLRVGHDNVKGYALADFTEAFDRYLPPASQDPATSTETPKQLSRDGDLQHIPTETGLPGVSVEGRPNPTDSNLCFDVSDERRGVMTDELEEFVI